MKHVDRLLGKTEVTEAAGTETAQVHLHISGQPKHVTKALGHLHKSFGRRLAGQADKLPGEKEIGIKSPHSVVKAKTAKPTSDTHKDEVEKGLGHPHSLRKADKYSEKSRHVDGEKEVGLGHPHRLPTTDEEAGADGMDESVSPEAVHLVDQLLEVDDPEAGD